jgi:hypothetical protein
MRPVSIQFKGQPPRRLINGEFLSAFYLLPAEIVVRAGGGLLDMPRSPKLAIFNPRWWATIESDLFTLLMTDGFASLAWPHFGIPASLESFSGYDPLWQLAHAASLWVEELTNEKIIRTPQELIRLPINAFFDFTSLQDANEYMKYIVPHTIRKYNYQPLIDAVCEMRCHEDFDYRESRAKIDFYRKWNHSRAKIQSVSLEQLGEEYERTPDIPDPTQNFDNDVCEQADIDTFKATLTPIDLTILQLRLEGYTQKEIAEHLGYKTHSTVTKRIQKLADQFDDFRDECIGTREFIGK